MTAAPGGQASARMPALDAWLAYLNGPVDGASLAVFRICFGLLIACESLKYFGANWVYRYYIEPGFYFSYLPFVLPLPGPLMYLVFAAIFVLALMVAGGFAYRMASASLCLFLSYIFLIDKTNYLNHMYLICLLSFLLALTPADHALSYASRKLGERSVPRWSLIVFRAQVALVFFFAGLAKLNSDWLAGYPQTDWLRERSGLPGISALITQGWTAQVVTWGGIAIDLSVGFLLCLRKTFWLGALVVTVFLLTNGYLFNIGVFPYIMIAAVGLFAYPSYPRRFLKQGAATPPPGEAPQGAALALIVFLHVYMAVQVLLPLRHFLYPGNVDWTEDGHRFAWRMMLRDKGVILRMFVVEPGTGMRRQVNPLAYLTPRQARVMGAKPDMLAQFAHHLADLEEERTGRRPQVTAEVSVSLNGRAYQKLVDPDLDLAAIDYQHRPACTWVLAAPASPPGGRP